MPDTRSFYDAVARYSKSIVLLDGRPMTVRTFSFLEYLLYERDRRALTSSETLDAKFAAFVGMTTLVTGGNAATAFDLPAIYQAVADANPPVPEFPWQREDFTDKRPAEDIVLEDSSTYIGQDVVWIVSQLAGEYGWSSDHILNELTCYEVLCYLQEVIIRQHDKQVFLYTLAADVGVEKVGGEYKKMPFPELPWRRKRVVRQTATKAMPSRFKPDGVVIDLTDPEVVKGMTNASKRDTRS